MGVGLRTRVAIAAALVVLVGTVLAGQAVADSLLPEDEVADTGRTLGRAGFAYLTGVRTYAAAVLWNRIDPLFHDYYEDLPLQEQTFMLPSIRAIVALDPQFEQTYYVAAWVLAQRGSVDEGVELARLGVENNPTSGMLRANYAQILFLFTDDSDEAVRQATRTLEDDIVWRTLFDQYDGYAMVRGVYSAVGAEEAAARVSQEMRRIDDEIDELGLVPEGHGN